MEAGKIVQVMGPVVDVEFPPGEIPEMMTALLTSNVGIDDKVFIKTIMVYILFSSIDS